jgi:hypothetical protein
MDTDGRGKHSTERQLLHFVIHWKMKITQNEGNALQMYSKFNHAFNWYSNCSPHPDTYEVAQLMRIGVILSAGDLVVAQLELGQEESYLRKYAWASFINMIQLAVCTEWSKSQLLKEKYANTSQLTFRPPFSLKCLINFGRKCNVLWLQMESQSSSCTLIYWVTLNLIEVI